VMGSSHILHHFGIKGQWHSLALLLYLHLSAFWHQTDRQTLVQPRAVIIPH
jgi:hypothetical protein